ncbi:MAG TPA: HlyD family efflux transporter periplasmic adaptor subunit [Candidatus Blautia stercoripullorum]|uniref:HlyD family efflux transporter periplasmic adaptor subunit n=1 Tax=Candidatus Blautia stercoripullorum TaxID=2838502 RepID=A0A9D2R9Q5_9FIRM|nr:HlyD family efflux transporter periplasmic adaptor subunit [Candidatus Blautia stercoripullorum]
MKLEDKKRMAAKAFAVFFLFMAAAGGLSRAAAAMTVPLADTRSYQEGRLNLDLTGTAVAEAKEETLVSLDKEQRILSAAKTGTQVKAGDVLVQYDTKYLQKAVEEKRAEVKKLELSLEQARIQGEPQERVAASNGAARDLDLADQGLAQAQSDYDQAVNDSQNAQNQAQSDYDAGVAQADQDRNNAYSQAQALEEQAQELETQGSQLESQGDSEGAGAQYTQAEDLRQQAQALRQEADQAYEAALSQVQAEYDAAVSQAQDILSQAEAALNDQAQAQAQAQNAYTSAQEEDAAAAANDQKSQAASSYDQQSIQVDLDQAKKELSQMEKIQQAKGQVTAPADGVVTDRNVQTGGITDDSSYLILGTGGLQIKGSLKLQDLEKVEPEDTVEITVSGQGKKLQGKVTCTGAEGTGETAQGTGALGQGAGTAQDTDAGGYFYADIEDASVTWGAQVSYSIEKQSDSSYEMLIPLSAVRQDAEGTYCLIAQAGDTVLGTEYRAVRVNITVEDKDSTQAAVTGNLGRDDLVISGSTKEITEGDKVRLKE